VEEVATLKTHDPRLGYAFAVLAAIISGVSIYVNSFGVKQFHDATLYTLLKNGVVGVALLIPLVVLPARRAEYLKLNRRQSAWLVALAVTGGSVPYVLFFSGLLLTNAITASVINHMQFAIVALIAVVFLRERISAAMWAGLIVLLVGATLGTNLGKVHWDMGAYLVAASTVLFAIDFVIAKHLLKDLSTLSVMTAKMSLGSLLLLGYAAYSGSLAKVPHLTFVQWRISLLVGLILLAFTVSTFIAIRHISVTAVIAIGQASPIVTALLGLAVTGKLGLPLVNSLGLLVTLVAVAAILVAGSRTEMREVRRPAPLPADQPS